MLGSRGIEARSLIDDLRNRTRSRPLRIVVGGSAFRHAPRLVEELGVEGTADNLRSALELFERT